MTRTEVIAAKFEQLEAMAADSRLTSAELRVNLVLLKYFNREHGYAWPSRNLMVEETNMHRSTVTRAVAGLEHKGYWAVQHNQGRGKNNRYFPAFLIQQADTEKGAAVRPFIDKAETNEEKDAAPHERDAAPRIKGRSPAHKRAQRCGKTPIKKPIKKPSNIPVNAQPLASPLDSGSRLSNANLETSSGDDRPKEAWQDKDGKIDGGASMSPPELRLRTFGLHINENRDPVKDKAYWTQRELSKKAAEMSPHDREEYWNKEMGEVEAVNV